MEQFNQASYSLEEIKSLISSNLFTSTDKINAAITRRDWFKSSTFYQEVLRLTEQHPDITFAGRLALILADSPICKYCNTRQLSYYNKILETCGNQECISKSVNQKQISSITSSDNAIEHNAILRRSILQSKVGTYGKQYELFDTILKSTSIESDYISPTILKFPDNQIAVEYINLYQSTFDYVSTKEQRLSQQNKQIYYRTQGIQLLQVISTQDQTKFLELLKSKLGIFNQRIYARKCNIQVINKSIAQLFIEQYHMQGCKLKTFSNAYGMFYDNELLGVITICNSRFQKDEIELHRMAFKAGVQIVGGVSKFMSFLKQEIGSFVTYADAMIGGGSYIKAGGKLLHLTEPNYWYVKMNGTIVSRTSAQKHKLKDLLGSDYNELLTEQENMLTSGYSIFYDAGHYKFQF